MIGPERKTIRNVLKKFESGNINTDKAIDKLFTIMSRAGRPLFIDRSIDPIEPKLCCAGYITEGYYRTDPKEIKKRLHGRILVTRNAKRYIDPKDMKKYHYGILLVTDSDPKLMAKQILLALKKDNFVYDLEQVITV